MHKIQFFLENKIPMLIDGAMGTQLQAKGMPKGINPAEFALNEPEVIKEIHKSYLQAGANIILTCTFGGTSFKLPPHINVKEFNKTLAKTAREAIAESGVTHPCFVGGDIGPSGHFVRPLGDVYPLDLFEAYKEQVQGLVEGGVDLIFIETQFDLAEIRIAVAAAHAVCDLPVFASMTFEDGVSLTGSTPEIFASTMENMQVDAVGVNCGAGPEQMLSVVEKLLASCTLPVFAEANAGLPELINDETVFRLEPKPFAEKSAELAKKGVFILGGCCGTTPQHIFELQQAVQSLEKSPSLYTKRHTPSGITVTSRSQLIRIGVGYPISLIGERINPTGKKLLSAEFQGGSTSLALKYASEQIDAGTNLLDVNVGAAHVDEPIFLPKMIEQLVAKYSTPLVLDSSNANALIAALPYYPGSALLNSISGEEGRMEALASHCVLWGAPCVLLPLEGSELPKTASERIRIIVKLLQKAYSYGISKNMIIVDVLALTAASDPTAPKTALDTLAWCAKEGIATTIGLSNISFGLPARELINAAFLSLAGGVGLNCCIGNPMNIRFKEELDSVNLLLGYDKDAAYFIDTYSDYSATTSGASGVSTASKSAGQLKGKAEKKESTLESAVIKGDKENIIDLIDTALAKGISAFDIVNVHLIPALNIVGEKYERKEYFLPQLLRSAETMQHAFQHVKPMLTSDSENAKAKVVFATVEGDIHDIGKNIVCLLLANHGYDVIDLGKDVKADVIIEKAIEYQADVIGLSALMTTTMPRMKDVIELVHQKKLNTKVIIGGAVVTQDYANSIGADGYSTDAVSCVRLLEKILV